MATAAFLFLSAVCFTFSSSLSGNLVRNKVQSADHFCIFTFSSTGWRRSFNIYSFITHPQRFLQQSVISLLYSKSRQSGVTKCNKAPVFIFLSAGFCSKIILCRLQEQLLPERWEAFSVHLRKHPLLQNPSLLLEGPPCEDVHDWTQCHPSVSWTHPASCNKYTPIQTFLIDPWIFL